MSHTSSSYISYNPGEKSETQHKEYQLNTNNCNNNLKSDQQVRPSSSSSLLDSYGQQLATTATSEIKTKVVFNDISNNNTNNNNYRDVKKSNEIIDVEEEKDEVKAASSAVEASIREEAVHLKGKKLCVWACV